MAPALKDFVPHLIDELKSPDTERRTVILRVLAALGPHAIAALRPVFDCLDDGAPQVQEATAAAIGHFGPHAAPLIPELTERLTDSRTAVRASAVRTLGAMGLIARDARPALLIQLKDRDAAVRKLAALALENMRER